MTMIKKTALLLVAVVVAIAVLTAGCTFNVGTPSPSPSVSTMNTYNSTQGFTMKYPSDWTKDESNATLAVIFVLPTNNNTENLNVQVANLSEGETFATVSEGLKENVQGYDNFTLLTSNNTTLAGQQAGKIVFTANVNGDFVKVQQVWTVKDGKAYVITYKAAPNNYDTYANTAQQMIDSFTTT